MILLGDVHGKYHIYHKIARRADYSVQLGDFGFKYGILNDLDSSKHKILGGNHDNYNIIKDCPYYLGDFGTAEVEPGLKFFFVRGGHSIDRAVRQRYIDWWPEEELNTIQQAECIKQYEIAKPDIVLSHEAPSAIVRIMFPNTDFLESWGYHKDWSSNTAKFLQCLYDIHQPLIWAFGHFHSDRYLKVGKTSFRCLNELSTLNLTHKHINVSTETVSNIL